MPSIETDRPTKSELLNAAEILVNAGCRVIPCDDKRPTLANWNKGENNPKLKIIERWLDSGVYNGVGIVCGTMSGNRYEIDCETPESFEQLSRQMFDAGLMDGKNWVVIETGRGYRLAFRTEQPLKIATRPTLAKDAEGKVKIELLGEGCFAVYPPSWHPSGKRYRLRRGDMQRPPILTAEQAEELFTLCRSLDEQIKEKTKHHQPQIKWEYSAEDVEKAFNARHDVSEILKRNGYRVEGDKAWRPSSSDPTPSITILSGGDLSHHFGTNDRLHGQGGGSDGCTFNPFGLFVSLEHSGDYKAAVRTASASMGMDGGKADGRDRGNTGASGVQVAAAPTTAKIEDSADPLRFLEDLNPIDVELTDWLWHRRIALGALTHLAGEVGVGKTSIALDIAAHVSTGRGWGDGIPCPKGKVILIMEEDNKNTSLIPRLLATGADHNQIKRLTINTFENDLHRLAAILADPRMADTRLVVIDPIGNYLGDANSDKDSAVRNVMKPLVTLAERHGIAVLTVGHMAKSRGGSLLNRCLGSKAFTGMPRSVLGAGKDGDGCFAILQAKNSDDAVADGLRYKLEPVTMSAPNGVEFTKARVVWDGTTTLSESELIAIVDGSENQTGMATEWLRDLLADGNARKATEIYTAGEQDGISKTTLWRAKDKLGVRHYRVGFGKGSYQAWMMEVEQSTAASESM